MARGRKEDAPGIICTRAPPGRRGLSESPARQAQCSNAGRAATEQDGGSFQRCVHGDRCSQLHTHSADRDGRLGSAGPYRARERAMKENAERVRFDRWLWAARIYKSRSLATRAIVGGKARLGGRRVKPGASITLGDI